MISAEEKQRIVAAFGENYTPGIIAKLTAKGLRNKFGNPYGSSAIRQLVNGIRQNIQLEIEILRLIKDEELKNKSLLETREKLSVE